MAAEAVTYGGSRFSDTAELETDAIMSGCQDGHGALEEELSSGDEDAFSDDLSSSPSVPDEDIDFEHVYALHNFMATVEGQASVSKGDSLTLLDDSNSYWWLVRVLKTQAVGYIPAENIETPFERLARLNKHRNVDEDHATGAGSAQMRTRIGNKPLKPRPPKPSPGQVSAENRVMFTAPTYYEHSGDEYSDEYYDEEGEEGVEFEGQDGFDEEDDLEEDDEETDGDDDTLVEDHRAVSVDQQLSPSLGETDAEEQQRRRNRAQALGNQMRVQAGQAPVSTSPQAGGQGQLQAQQAVAAGHPAGLVAGSPPRGPGAVSPAAASNTLANRAPTPHTSAQRSPHASVDDEAFLASTSSGSTRKIILTPPVAQEDDLSSQGHDDAMAHQPRKLRKSSREDDTAAAAAAAMAASAVAPMAVSPASEDEAPKKKGGMFSSLFKKKDKRKDGGGDGGRSSDETPRSTTPTGGSHLGVQTANLSPSRRLDSASPSPTDPSRPWQPQSPSALHQQHAQRPRGDAYLADATRRQQQLEAQHVREGSGHRLAPGMASSPQGTLSPPNLSSAASSPGTPVRPMRPGSLIGSPNMGGDVPVLSVLRVFAGEGIESESTFKTVLLNESTTTPDLVRQAVQRFRLPMEQIESFYLTIRELGSDETPIGAEQMPLEMFERTSERGSTLPSVKRSSVGSISSVASNLSLNPAIAKLGMGDYSDDSSAKLYLHRRDAQRTARTTAEPSKAAPPTSPTLRFALRAIVYPADMPDGVMWDPHANALVLRPGEPNQPQEVREKVLFFPANVNVAEVLETCLDRFGIVGGVVEGGDEVEDKLAKRRSITRVRYSLAAMRNEAILSPGSRVLDAYDSAPIFKEHERSSKEFRRRSADAAMILGSTADLQPTDPVFVLRNAALLHGHRSALVAAAAEDGPRKQRPQQPARIATDQSTGESVYATPSEELATAPLATSPRDAIAAQRAQTRANQRGQMLSAQKNAAQGVDIRLADRSMIRSSRTPAGGGRNVRYSYIDQDGAEIDISEAVEAEFAGGSSKATPAGLAPRSASSTGSSSADEFATPQASPDGYETHDREEQAAIDALRAAPVTIGTDSSSTIRTREPGATSSRQSNRGDVLEAALASPTPEETLEARINRVLNKVKSGSSGGGVASALRQVRRPGETGGRASPALGRSSPAPGGRASPAPGVRSASPALTPGRRHATPTRAHHAHQPSDSTIGSESTHGTGPSTPAGSAMTNGTSPATRAGSAVPAQRVAYRDDFGLDVLLALVHDATPAAPPARPPRQPGVDELFGPALDANAHKWYPTTAKSLLAIEESRIATPPPSSAREQALQGLARSAVLKLAVVG